MGSGYWISTFAMAYLTAISIFDAELRLLSMYVYMCLNAFAEFYVCCVNVSTLIIFDTHTQKRRISISKIKKKNENLEQNESRIRGHY